MDCFRCVPNGFRDSKGYCLCSDDWKGNSCELWGGQCEARCVGCKSPSPFECESCVPNAVYEDGLCECHEVYTGVNCEIYIGICNPRCAYGCSGPTEADCFSCIDTAYRASDTGVCECLHGRLGVDCSIADIECPGRCNGCLDADTCIKCTNHAERNEYG